MIRILLEAAAFSAFSITPEGSLTYDEQVVRVPADRVGLLLAGETSILGPYVVVSSVETRPDAMADVYWVWRPPDCACVHIAFLVTGQTPTARTVPDALVISYRTALDGILMESIFASDGGLPRLIGNHETGIPAPVFDGWTVSPLSQRGCAVGALGEPGWTMLRLEPGAVPKHAMAVIDGGEATLTRVRRTEPSLTYSAGDLLAVVAVHGSWQACGLDCESAKARVTVVRGVSVRSYDYALYCSGGAPRAFWSAEATGEEARYLSSSGPIDAP